MKYVENNFLKAEGNRIYDPELTILKPFLNELKNNQSVECICLMPEYIEESFGFCSIKISIFARNAADDFNNIQHSIKSLLGALFYKKYKIINNFRVEIQDATSFLENKELCNVLYRKSLVSSYIVFDRTGVFEKLQEELKDQIKPWESIIELENIDELEKDDTKNKVLSKKR